MFVIAGEQQVSNLSGMVFSLTSRFTTVIVDVETWTIWRNLCWMR